LRRYSVKRIEMATRLAVVRIAMMSLHQVAGIRVMIRTLNDDLVIPA
jgi:hypothetical protein